MRDVLMSHTVASLKKMVNAYNIKGYSKLKKPALIDLMTSKEHINKFKHIKAKTGKAKPTHKMPNGDTHTGKTHTKDSKLVKPLTEEQKKRLKEVSKGVHKQGGEFKYKRVKDLPPLKLNIAGREPYKPINNTKKIKAMRKKTGLDKNPKDYVADLRKNRKSAPKKEKEKETLKSTKKENDAKINKNKKSNLIAEINKRGKVVRKERKDFGKDDPIRKKEEDNKKKQATTAQLRHYIKTGEKPMKSLGGALEKIKSKEKEKPKVRYTTKGAKLTAKQPTWDTDDEEIIDPSDDEDDNKPLASLMPKGSKANRKIHSGQVESYGISKAQANKMNPMDLFSLLPPELTNIILEKKVQSSRWWNDPLWRGILPSGFLLKVLKQNKQFVWFAINQQYGKRGEIDGWSIYERKTLSKFGKKGDLINVINSSLGDIKTDYKNAVEYYHKKAKEEIRYKKVGGKSNTPRSIMMDKILKFNPLGEKIVHRGGHGDGVIR